MVCLLLYCTNISWKGVDKDWKLLAAQNEVSYYGLSSGTYTFRVRLPGNEQSEAVYQVTVRPMIPWWGWALSVLLVVGIIAFIRYYVWNRMRRLLTSPASAISASIENTQQKDQTIEQAEVISEESSIAATEEKYKTNRLTEEECKELHKKLVAYVEKEKAIY